MEYNFISSPDSVGNRTIVFTTVADGDKIKIFHLELKYSEVRFIYENDTQQPTVLPVGQDQSLPIETPYLPNSVKTYILDKQQNSYCEDFASSSCHNQYLVGISLEILQLNLDFDRGDYLLIGPGDRPEFWKNSQVHMIAQRIRENEQAKERRKIWINADSAFIR